MQCSPVRHKDLHHCPYKVQVAQELSERDKVILLQFCNEFLDLVKNESNVVNTLLMSSDGHFRVNPQVPFERGRGSRRYPRAGAIIPIPLLIDQLSGFRCLVVFVKTFQQVHM